jgi:hypothetical protein
LEACRPRQLGASLPKPLESLLSLKQCALSIKAAKRTESIIPKSRVTEEDIRLQEWGTVDFGKLMRLHTSSRPNQGSNPGENTPKMTSLNQSAIKAEKSQGSDVVSPGSSFACSPLSSTYGTSFDRVFWDYYDSPKTPGKELQIQRSPSFQFDGAPIEADREKKDDSNAASDNVSKSSFGGESDNNSQSSKADKDVNQLRQFMEAYDERICMHVPVNDHPNSAEKSENLSGGVNTKAAMARFHR